MKTTKYNVMNMKNKYAYVGLKITNMRNKYLYVREGFICHHN